jgi:hypothetical protein
MLPNGQTRRYSTTMEHGSAYYKTGIDPSGSIGHTDVIYHDNVATAAP